MTEAIVVDASAVLAMLVVNDTAFDPIASRLASARLHAPDHLPVEVTNVLRRRRNAGILSEVEARFAFDAFLRLPTQLWPLESLAVRVWELGHNLTSYDAAYVAIAEHLSAPLITADARLSRASGPRCAIEVFDGSG